MNMLRAALCVLSFAEIAGCAETVEKSSQSLQGPDLDDGDAATGKGGRLVIDAIRPPMELPARNDGDARDDAVEPRPRDPRADGGSRTEPEPLRDAEALDSTQPLDAAQDSALPHDAFVEPGALCVAGELACAADQPMRCDSSQAFQPNGGACTPAALICEHGQCVEPGTALLGAAALDGAFETLGPNHFWATPIRTSGAVSVRSFGIVGEADNGLVRFAIYSDAVTPAGHYPDALVALGLKQNEVLPGYSAEVAPIGFVPLQSNAEYWLVVVSGSNPPSVAIHGAAAGTNVIRRAFPDGHNFSSPFPATFPQDGVASADRQLGVYVRVRPEE